MSTKNEDGNEELEQYGRRLCLRIDLVHVEKGETSEGVLRKVTSMCEEADLDILDAALDRAHCIGNKYVDNSKNVKVYLCVSLPSAINHDFIVRRKK